MIDGKTIDLLMEYQRLVRIDEDNPDLTAVLAVQGWVNSNGNVEIEIQLRTNDTSDWKFEYKMWECYSMDGVHDMLQKAIGFLKKD